MKENPIFVGACLELDVPVIFRSESDMDTRFWFFLGWCPGFKLDLGAIGVKWDGDAMVSRADGNFLSFIMRIILMINTKVSDLIGVQQSVVKSGTTVEGFICDQNTGFPETVSSHAVAPDTTGTS